MLLGPALFLWLGGLGFGIAEAEEDSIELFRVRSWSCSCSTPSTDTRLLGPDFFILEFISPIYRSPKVFEVSRRLIKSSIGVNKRAAVFVNPRVKNANERKKRKSQETSEPFPFCFLFQKCWLVGWLVSLNGLADKSKKIRVRGSFSIPPPLQRAIFI